MHSCPSFFADKEDDGPTRSLNNSFIASTRLYFSDFQIRIFHTCIHADKWIHSFVVCMDNYRIVSESYKIILEFTTRHTAKQGRSRNLVFIDMHNWQYRTITHWVEKFIALPRGSKRTSLSFSITDDSSDEKIRVIKSCTKCSRK